MSADPGSTLLSRRAALIRTAHLLGGATAASSFGALLAACNGEGEQVREKDKCKQCSGKKTVIERKVLHVHVDKGVQSGTKIDFRGEGDQMPGVEPGDVQFEIEQKPHPRFQRKGDDLYFHAEVDLLTALAGGAIYVEHLDERWLTVEILPGEIIAPGKQSR